MSVADKMLKEIVTLAKKVARQEHETGGLWDKNQQLEDERDNLAAEVEALKTQLENAQRELSEQSMVANVETQQDAAAWQQQLDAARAEIETLKGAMAADDRRLRNAEERIWPGKTWGCDAADKMADEIETLRKQLAEQQAETVDVRRQRNNETDRLNATNAVSVQQRDEIAYLRTRLDEERSVITGLRQQLDAANAAWNLQCAGIERLQAFVENVREAVNLRSDVGSVPALNRVMEVLAELDANSSAILTSSAVKESLTPTPVAEPLDRIEKAVLALLEKIAAAIDDTDLTEAARNDLVRLYAGIDHKFQTFNLPNGPTPVAEPLDAEGGK